MISHLPAVGLISVISVIKQLLRLKREISIESMRFTGSLGKWKVYPRRRSRSIYEYSGVRSKNILWATALSLKGVHDHCTEVFRCTWKGVCFLELIPSWAVLWNEAHHIYDTVVYLVTSAFVFCFVLFFTFLVAKLCFWDGKGSTFLLWVFIDMSTVYNVPHADQISKHISIWCEIAIFEDSTSLHLVEGQRCKCASWHLHEGFSRCRTC